MKILMAHNFYQQAGGEDKCFFAEIDLLSKHGHEVVTFTVDNKKISHMSHLEASRLSVWNSQSYQELSDIIRRARPDLVHFHNTFPLMSPSVFWAAKRQACAVVTTLHNYRLMCPVATFMRNGKICEDCRGWLLPWPGVVHGCYRGSRSASAAVAASLFTHRILRTWSGQVDLFITLTEFARRKFIEGGLPADKIAVKPNFIDPDPGAGKESDKYALFVGRLSPEKGIDTLLSAWSTLNGRMPLRVIGTGPLSSQVEAASSQSNSIDFLGQKQADEVMALIAGAAFLVLPSLWYETFGLVIIEGFASSKPVIASRLGAFAELVQESYTGLLFEPGDSDDLAAKVTWAVEHPGEMQTMGQNARNEYIEKYTAEKNYGRLMEIYELALTAARNAPIS